MGAEKSRSRTKAGKLQKRRLERGIDKGKYFHVGSINIKTKNQSSRISAFSNLLHPHHSKATEAKNSVYTIPWKGGHSIFQQPTPLLHKGGTMGTIHSPPSKNTSRKFPLIKYLCLFKTHLLTQQCKLGGLHDQLCAKI